jgi:hypothetical protein
VGAISDLQLNSWTLVDGSVAENGVVDTTTSNAVYLAYVNGAVSFTLPFIIIIFLIMQDIS